MLCLTLEVRDSSVCFVKFKGIRNVWKRGLGPAIWCLCLFSMAHLHNLLISLKNPSLTSPHSLQPPPSLSRFLKARKSSLGPPFPATITAKCRPLCYLAFPSRYLSIFASLSLYFSSTFAKRRRQPRGCHLRLHTAVQDHHSAATQP